MKIFFSVGEPSGDIHGAHLIRALKALEPSVQCVGFGGPRMQEAGGEIFFDLTSLAVMWVAQVLRNLRHFFQLADEAEKYFQTEKPDAVVLIDYPGFNWHIAKRAKKYHIPVYYYSPPQVWGWRQSRVKKLRRWTDCIFSGLPFETDWLREKGCRVEYVGHPFFDETETLELSEGSEIKQLPQPLVGLLPGSRTQEVHQNFPVFLRVAEKIHAERPDVVFAVAAFREEHAEWIRNQIPGSLQPFVSVFTQRTPEIIQTAHCCLSVSGSVSMELLAWEKPSVILYQIPRYAWWLQWYFRRVKYITLVNLLAVKNPFRDYNPEYTPHRNEALEVLFPEYLTYRDRTSWIADDLLRWLNDSACYATIVKRLQTLKSEVAQPGASQRAAQMILQRK